MPVPIVPIGLAAKFGMPAAGIGTGMVTGMGLMNQLGDKVDAARGYMTGYDTNQTPAQVAKERGLAGVAGGIADNITMGMTDFDKRGDSKKQKDTKEFLRKFIFGTQGVDARDVRDAVGGGDITSFNTGTEPGAKFGYTFNTK